MLNKALFSEETIQNFQPDWSEELSELDTQIKKTGKDIIADAEVATLLGVMLREHGSKMPEIPGDMDYSKLVYILRCCASTFLRCADEIEALLDVPEFDPAQRSEDEK